jgi:Dolichyl-phosphate-mannose-protein mannosyltransferase
MNRSLTVALCVVCLAVFCVRGWFTVQATSPTFDEAVHLTAGYSYWRTGDFRINRETPPLMKLLWAVPLLLTERPPFQPDADQWERKDIWRLGDAFLYESGVPYSNLLTPARGVNVVVGAVLVWLIGWWGLRLWGRATGVVAWALAALDPNLLGQSAVLSTDVGLTLFCTATVYALWEYAANPTPRWFYLSGVCLGLALATKFSAVVAIAGCGVGAIVLIRTGGTFAVPGQTGDGDRFGHLVSAFVRLGLVAAVTILPTYFVFQAVDWPRGFRGQIGRNELNVPHFYLNGEISIRGWWWYFFEVIALKTPAGTLALAALTLVAWRARARFTRRDLAFALTPPAVFFLAMSAARIDIGARVVLPAYPVLWLLAARLAALGSRSYHRWLAGIAVGVAIILPPVLDGDPVGVRSLSYFNGVVAGRADGHRYLGDSNIDWGQGLGSLSAKLREIGNPVIYLSYSGTARPEAEYIRFERLQGWGEFRDPPADRVDLTGRVLVAVSVSNLQGTYLREPTMYRWLLDRQPISRTDDSIWLFDVTGDEEAIRHLQEIAAMR